MIRNMPVGRSYAVTDPQEEESSDNESAVGALKRRKFYMWQHEDYKLFRVVSTTQSPRQDAREQSATETVNLFACRSESTDWKDVIKTAQATAAYPMAFPAIILENKTSAYEERVAGLRPEWESLSTSISEGSLRFAAVDGGVCNNEPFDLLRSHIKQRNNNMKIEADGDKVWSTMIMIEPFPTGPRNKKCVPEDGLRLKEVLGEFIRSVIDQSNFKYDQSQLREEKISNGLVDGEQVEFSQFLHVHDDSKLDKFMLFPKRKGKADGEFNLASEPMGAFAGMLDREIRHHDFLLGRKNCQNFLQKKLVIKRSDAERNPIFARHVRAMGDVEYIQIIPTLGTAEKPCDEPKWPDLKARQNDIAKDVACAAANRLTSIVARQLASNTTVQWAISKGLRYFLRKHIENLIHGSINDIMRKKYDSTENQNADS